MTAHQTFLYFPHRPISTPRMHILHQKTRLAIFSQCISVILMVFALRRCQSRECLGFNKSQYHHRPAHPTAYEICHSAFMTTTDERADPVSVPFSDERVVSTSALDSVRLSPGNASRSRLPDIDRQSDASRGDQGARTIRWRAFVQPISQFLPRHQQ